MKNNLTWAEHIDQWSHSNQSKKIYCERHGLSYPMFLYHQRKLLDKNGSSGFQEVIVSRQQEVSSVEYPMELKLQFSDGSAFIFSEQGLERVCSVYHSRH